MQTIGKHGRLITPNSPCPKCGSFMYMPREKGVVRFNLCKVCGFKGLVTKKLSWEVIKIYCERFWFWKLFKEQYHGRAKKEKELGGTT